MSFCILYNVVSENYSEQNFRRGDLLAAHGLNIVILPLALILCTPLVHRKTSENI